MRGEDIPCRTKQEQEQEHPHMRGEDKTSQEADPPIGNIPTCVGKTLIMLSKIKYLTFRNVPNLLTFDDFQKQRERQNHSLKVPKLNAKTFFSSVFKASATNLLSSNNALIPQKRHPNKNSTMKTENYFKRLFLLALWFFFCWHTCLKRAMASTSTIPIME